MTGVSGRESLEEYAAGLDWADGFLQRFFGPRAVPGRFEDIPQIFETDVAPTESAFAGEPHADAFVAAGGGRAEAFGQAASAAASLAKSAARFGGALSLSLDGIRTEDDFIRWVNACFSRRKDMVVANDYSAAVEYLADAKGEIAGLRGRAFRDQFRFDGVGCRETRSVLNVFAGFFAEMKGDIFVKAGEEAANAETFYKKALSAYSEAAADYLDSEWLGATERLCHRVVIKKGEIAERLGLWNVAGQAYEGLFKGGLVRAANVFVRAIEAFRAAARADLEAEQKWESAGRPRSGDLYDAMYSASAHYDQLRTQVNSMKAAGHSDQDLIDELAMAAADRFKAAGLYLEAISVVEKNGLDGGVVGYYYDIYADRCRRAGDHQNAGQSFLRASYFYLWAEGHKRDAWRAAMNAFDHFEIIGDEGGGIGALWNVSRALASAGHAMAAKHFAAEAERRAAGAKPADILPQDKFDPAAFVAQLDKTIREAKDARESAADNEVALACIIEARALIQQGRYHEAIRILKDRYAVLEGSVHLLKAHTLLEDAEFAANLLAAERLLQEGTSVAQMYRAAALFEKVWPGREAYVFWKIIEGYGLEGKGGVELIEPSHGIAFAFAHGGFYADAAGQLLELGNLWMEDGKPLLAAACFEATEEMYSVAGPSFVDKRFEARVLHERANETDGGKISVEDAILLADIRREYVIFCLKERIWEDQVERFILNAWVGLVSQRRETPDCLRQMAKIMRLRARMEMRGGPHRIFNWEESIRKFLCASGKWMAAGCYEEALEDVEEAERICRNTRRATEVAGESVKRAIYDGLVAQVASAREKVMAAIMEGDGGEFACVALSDGATAAGGGGSGIHRAPVARSLPFDGSPFGFGSFGIGSANFVFPFAPVTPTGAGFMR